MLSVAPLAPEAFAPFGEVIQVAGSRHYTINDGYAERHHDLARVDVMEQDGRPLINIFRAKPRALPMRIRMMERHPLSSQAFIPLEVMPFLVVVAAPGSAPAPDPTELRAFITDGRQGVNYARGTWHYPLIAIDRPSDFLVIDRGGPGINCDEITLDGEIILGKTSP
jgi:ureidoglycolate lyase